MIYKVGNHFDPIPNYVDEKRWDELACTMNITDQEYYKQLADKNGVVVLYGSMYYLLISKDIWRGKTVFGKYI